MHAVSSTLMLPVFPLILAAYLPGAIKAAVKQAIRFVKRSADFHVFDLSDNSFNAINRQRFFGDKKQAFDNIFNIVH